MTPSDDQALLLRFVDTRPAPGFADRLLTLAQLQQFDATLGPDDLAPARALRDALAGCLLASTERGRAEVEALWQEAGLQPRTSGPGRIGWRVSTPGALARLSATLLGTTVELWLSGDIEQIGVCAASSCIVPFVDGSPRHNRTFCSPGCATRTRVERHRRRQRETAGPATTGERPG